MSLAGLRVLVVEDHDFQRRTLVRILRNLGSGDVLEAADGEAALRVLDDADERPDVVVCDLELPGIDGAELLRRIGARAAGQQVVIASGMEDGVLEAAATAATGAGLEVLGSLAKPITAAGLLGALERRAAGAAPTAPDAGDDVALELLRDPEGAPAAFRAIGPGATDEDLLVLVCRAHRHLKRSGRPLPGAVVLPAGVASVEGSADRLAGRAALEGVAPRHLTLVVVDDGEAGAALRERLAGRGFAVDGPGSSVPPAGGAPAGDRVRTAEELVALVGRG